MHVLPESRCLEPEYSSQSAGSWISSKISHCTGGSLSSAVMAEVDLMLGSFTDLKRATISLSMSSLAGMGMVGAADPAAINGGISPIPHPADESSMTPRATVRPAWPPIGRRRQGTAGELTVMDDVPLRVFWALTIDLSFSKDVGKARHCNIPRVASSGITQNLMHKPLQLRVY